MSVTNQIHLIGFGENIHDFWSLRKDLVEALSSTISKEEFVSFWPDFAARVTTLAKVAIISWGG